MIDPQIATESTLTTYPPARPTPLYRKRPKTYGMMGRAVPYLSQNGETLVPQTKPTITTLAAWDYARKHEPIIKEGINVISLSVAAKVGEYSHPDSEICDFVQANLTRVKRWIYDITKSCLWSGYGVSEIIYTPKMGPRGIPQVWFEDFVSYHPAIIDLVTNDNGRLTHGEKMASGIRQTGVWVPRPLSTSQHKKEGDHYMVRLPRSKVFHTCIEGEGNNPYGTSMLSAVLDFHLYKRAVLDLMMVALDRYGTPLIYVVVPNVYTDEVDPQDPERRLKLQEVTARELEDIRTESVMVFSQPSKDQPISMQAVTTSNNFADSFTKAIELCDLNMMMGMGIPNLIMRDTNNGLGTSGASERQVEMFHHFISSIFSQIIDDFLSQSILQLIQYNFDPRVRPLANYPGSIAPMPIRFSETKVLIDGVDTLTKHGYLSPKDKVDVNHVRQMLYFPKVA